MCGIAGIKKLCTGSDLEPIVQRMIDAQRHRGPDDYGTIEFASGEDRICLGQCRLSIIDLTKNGHQPMTVRYDDGRSYTIVFNGEIYNFKSLRAELELAGERFNSRTDTEVILRAFAHWGEKSFARLAGIFAFALWDSVRGKLFLARDQLGVKPLYVYRSSECVAFASEVRALLASTMVSRKLSKSGLASFLAYGSVQEPYTLIEGVYSLSPGHYTVLSSDGNERAICYWNMADFVQPEVVRMGAQDATARVVDVLRLATKEQMCSDVPMGAFLSGGIDSSTIVSLMRQSGAEDLRTFSIVFDDSAYDERVYAKMVAERNRTNHTELLLDSQTVVSNLENSLSAFDQPSVDGLNTWYVSKLVKEAGLTVALSGVGGDEFFIGYDAFKKQLMFDGFGRMLRLIPRPFGAVGESIAFNDKIRRLFAMCGICREGYLSARRVFTDRQIVTLSPIVREMVGSWEASAWGYAQPVIGDRINRMSLFESQTYMLSTLLRDTDQMSMAHSLEVRVPLIDPRVVEIVLSLDGEYKRNVAHPKHLLVSAAGDGLPTECVNRPKRGFVLPFENWLRSSLEGRIKDFYNSDTPLFEGKILADMWRSFLGGRIAWSRIWMNYVLNDWCERNKVEI